MDDSFFYKEVQLMFIYCTANRF